ncbi:LytR C-terminal domain-containing protein [Natronogracilivirgula saccharolytica]|uniref:LytR C-terminal domain-containing protein n=1 Tax=Natronogracilivirga saccharolytica TaxID=2812953 RepID=A0A8J7UWA6_9BACT|nr:LytR C-terminal domain-containing protein [Natronogracilivirga saccharolytica]
MTEKQSSNFLLHSALGFLSILLLVLLAALFTRIIYPRVLAERSEVSVLVSDVIQVEVLNGCGVPGLATKFTSRLRQNGFDVVQSGNFETFDITETIVIDRSGNSENAKRVARALGVPETRIQREISSDFYLDATIVIGSDYENLQP